MKDIIKPTEHLSNQSGAKTRSKSNFKKDTTIYIATEEEESTDAIQRETK